MKEMTSRFLAAALIFAAVMGSFVLSTAADPEEPAEAIEPAAKDFTGYTEIATKADLNSIRNDLAGKYVLTADIEFTAADFAKNGAFYNRGYYWDPIGKDSKAPFTGVLDGNGHSIKGLKVHRSTQDNLYGGLFGYLNGATIRDLSLLDSSIEMTSSASKKTGFVVSVGGIASVAINATLTNCRTFGCSVKATAKSPYLQDYYVIPYAGGVVGRADSSTLTSCHSTSTVSASCSTGDPTAYAIAGGIVGQLMNGSRLEGCSNTGGVSISLGNSSGGASSYGDNGGIAGTMSDSSIINCQNAGAISGGASAEYGLVFSYTGGIVGETGNGSVISGVRNSGSIYFSTSLTSSGADAQTYAGGIIGSFEYGDSLTDAYNTGTVEARVSTRYNYGNPYASGIAAFVGKSVTLSRTYNMGTVKATVSSSSSKPPRGFYGGIAAFLHPEAVFESNYFLDKCLADSTGFSLARTEEQMKLADTYVGFDFDAVWAMDPNGTSPYPTLRGLEGVEPHTHAWSEKWSQSGSAHWRECTATGCSITNNRDKGDYALHTPAPDDGDCTTAILCTICGGLHTSAKKHSFINDCDPDCNRKGCTYIREVTHTPAADDEDCTTAVPCSVCGETCIEAKAHSYANDCDTGCDREGCSYVREVAHTPAADDGDCTTAVPCTTCGETCIEAKAHAYKNGCDAICDNGGCTVLREVTHTPEADDGDCRTAVLCSACGDTVTEAKPDHVYTDDMDATCDACGQERQLSSDTGAAPDEQGTADTADGSSESGGQPTGTTMPGGETGESEPAGGCTATLGLGTALWMFPAALGGLLLSHKRSKKERDI